MRTIAVTLLLAASAAQADVPLPDIASASAFWSMQVFDAPDNMMQYGSTLGSHDIGTIGITASVDSSIAPIPYAATSIAASHAGFASASLSMTYEYRVIAADLAAYQALDAYLAANQANGLGIGIDFSGTALLGTSGPAAASVSVFGGLGNGYDVHLDCYEGSGDCGGFNHAGQASLTASTPADLTFYGFLTLSASVTKTFGSFAFVADARVDPALSLTAGFGPATNYTLMLSPGVANASGPPVVAGVPEPATWALLIAGFGLTGAALRRRNAATA